MWDKILYITKWIGGTIGIVTIIISIYSYFDNMNDNILKKEDITVIVTNVMTPLSNQITELQQGQCNIITKQLQLEEGQKRIGNVIVNHVKNDNQVTKDDLINIMNELKIEIKKNNEILLPLGLKQITSTL